MRRAVVLLSGGLDSATCLAWAVREGFAAHALTVRYGQRHEIEIERAAIIAARCEAASHRIVTVDLSILSGSALTDPSVDVPKSRSSEEIGSGIPVTYVPARNMIFLALAAAWGESMGARDLVIGVNAVDYSGYPDCRPAFLRAFEALAECGTKAGVEGERFRVHAPLLESSKAQIIRNAVSWGVPYGLTVSCYDPGADGTACGRCDACLIRSRGFREAGIPDERPGR